jgi:hypothetical protein
MPQDKDAKRNRGTEEAAVEALTHRGCVKFTRKKINHAPSLPLLAWQNPNNFPWDYINKGLKNGKAEKKH